VAANGQVVRAKNDSAGALDRAGGGAAIRELRNAKDAGAVDDEPRGSATCRIGKEGFSATIRGDRGAARRAAAIEIQDTSVVHEVGTATVHHDSRSFDRQTVATE